MLQTTRRSQSIYNKIQCYLIAHRNCILGPLCSWLELVQGRHHFIDRKNNDHIRLPLPIIASHITGGILHPEDMQSICHNNGPGSVIHRDTHHLNSGAVCRDLGHLLEKCRGRVIAEQGRLFSRTHSHLHIIILDRLPRCRYRIPSIEDRGVERIWLGEELLGEHINCLRLAGWIKNLPMDTLLCGENL